MAVAPTPLSPGQPSDNFFIYAVHRAGQVGVLGLGSAAADDDVGVGHASTTTANCNAMASSASVTKSVTRLMCIAQPADNATANSSSGMLNIAAAI